MPTRRRRPRDEGLRMANAKARFTGWDGVHEQTTRSLETCRADLQWCSSRRRPCRWRLRGLSRRVVWVSLGLVRPAGASAELDLSGEAGPTESGFSKHTIGKLETYQWVFMQTSEGGRKGPAAVKLARRKFEHSSNVRVGESLSYTVFYVFGNGT